MLMKELMLTAMIFTFCGGVFGDVSFNVEQGSEIIPARGIAEVTIRAEWPQGTNAYVIYPPLMPQISGLEMIDHVTFGQSLTVDSQVIQRVVHYYKFSVTNAGLCETGPIFIDYKLSSGGEISHKKLSGVNFKIKRIGKMQYMIYVAIILFVPLISTILILRLTRRKIKQQKSLSIEDKFLEDLERIKRYRIDGETKKYFNEISGLIKNYFRKKYQIASLPDYHPNGNGKNGSDKFTVGAAKELLELSHNVCYAGYQPSNIEEERIFNFIKKLLERNRPHKTSAEEDMYLKS